MTFTQAIVAERLGERPYRFYESVPSTMDVAREWLAGGAPQGAMVLAAQQTAGRGRMGRPWLNAGTSAIALSIILRVAGDALPRISMLGGLVVLDALNAVGVRNSTLKWPNDVLIGGRKVSGILVEASWDGARMSGVVLGIGLNVSGSFAGSDVAASAISIGEALGREPDIRQVFSALVDGLDLRLPDLTGPQMYHAWRSRLGTLGTRVRVEGGGVLEGIAEDVSEVGALLIRGDDGQLTSVLAGDVRVRPV